MILNKKKAVTSLSDRRSKANTFYWCNGYPFYFTFGFKFNFITLIYESVKSFFGLEVVFHWNQLTHRERERDRETETERKREREKKNNML
jgi:hypothetical protein